MDKSQNLVALLILVLIGGGLFLYKSFFSEEVIIETETVAREAANAKILFNEINRIDFDREYFNSPLVNTLSNSYFVPSEQIVGRSNPFNPVVGSGPQSIPLSLEVDIDATGEEAKSDEVSSTEEIQEDNI